MSNFDMAEWTPNRHLDRATEILENFAGTAEGRFVLAHGHVLIAEAKAKLGHKSAMEDAPDTSWLTGSAS